MNYSLKELIKTFQEHAESFEKQKKERLGNSPEGNLDDFNLPLALYVMCVEIQNRLMNE